MVVTRFSFLCRESCIIVFILLLKEIIYIKFTDMNHLVIMAGGSGSRFWPLSTEEMPKQFVDVLGVGQSLIQLTVSRFGDLFSPDRIWIVTSKNYVDLVREQLPDIPESHILAEPVMRNTAPCIAYVAWKIKEFDPDANLLVSPSDHIVTDNIGFKEIIRSGLTCSAMSDKIITIGITPHRPETGYGYIKVGTINCENLLQRVDGFTEKPTLEVAKQYLDEKYYFWNSGIFMWNVKIIEQAFREFQPDIASIFDQIAGSFFTAEEQSLIDSYYPFCDNISIDYAIMEHAENIYMIPAAVGWSDLGTWGALHSLSDKDRSSNSLKGGVVKLIEAENCLVSVSATKQCIIDGLKDYIIVENEGALLICRFSKEQNIKEWIKNNY